MKTGPVTGHCLACQDLPLNRRGEAREFPRLPLTSFETGRKTQSSVTTFCALAL